MKDIPYSRREFINKLKIMSGSVALAGSLPWIDVLQAKAAKNTPSNRVRLGVIGTGSRGNFLLLRLLKIPSTEIVAFCDNYDPHYQKASKIIADGNCKAKGFVDYKKMIAEVPMDGVVIASPLYEHARMIIDSFSAGLHVFCEKTLAKTAQECLDVINLQKKTNKVLQIGLQRYFDPSYIKAVKDIREGNIGKIGQIRAYWHRNASWRRKIPSPELERKLNWRLYREYSLGLMTELANHQIHVANWILQETPTMVTGLGGINYWKDGREVYDNVNLIYKYPSGVHLVYDSMISNKHYGVEEQILGDKGTYELEIKKIYKEDWAPPPTPPAIVRLITDIERNIFDTIPLGGASWAPEIASQNPGEHFIDINATPENKLLADENYLQLEAFVESIRKNKPIPEFIKGAFNSSIATIFGDESMQQQKVLQIPEKFKL